MRPKLLTTAPKCCNFVGSNRIHPSTHPLLNPSTQSTLTKKRQPHISIFGSRATAVVSLALTLIMLGLAALTVDGARNAAERVRTNLAVLVKVKAGASDDGVNALKRRLAVAPYVESHTYTSAETVMAEEAEYVGEDVMGLLDENPYNAEFELHLRAVLGLPIPGITLDRAGASAVVLSKTQSDKPLDYKLDKALAQERTIVRIFGKSEAHVGRRMGVVVCYDSPDADVNALRDKAKAIAETIL